MGTTQSSLSAIQQNRHLVEFAGPAAIAAGDGAYWNELLSLPFSNLFTTLYVIAIWS